MKKCDVCGKKFNLKAKNRYEVMITPVGFERLSKGIIFYNAFDCPHCGCQNIVGVVEKTKVEDYELIPKGEGINGTEV